jgi:hypothetical protein
MEVVFNYYGYILEYINVESISELRVGLKNIQEKEYAGIVTWFLDNRVRHPKSTIGLLSKGIELNKKILRWCKKSCVNS